MKYAVIGGGITGLCAAYSLQKKGFEVTVFDDSGNGGLIQSEIRDGFTLEKGAFTLVDTPALQALVEELGLKESFTYPELYPYKQYVWYQNQAVAVPRNPLQLIFSKLFSLGEKLRIIAQLFRPLRDGLKLRTRSIGEVLSEHFSPAVVDNVVDPVLRGIFGGDPWRLSFHLVFPNLYQMLVDGGSFFGYLRSRKTLGRRKIFHMKGGNAKLIEKLQQRLGKCLIIDRVKEVCYSESKYQIITQNGLSKLFDGVCVTTSGGATAGFISAISKELADRLKQVAYAPLIVAHLSLEKDIKLLADGFGILFPSGALTKILGVLFNSQLFSDVAPKDKQVITVCLSGEYINHSDDSIAAIIQKDLTQFLNIPSSKILLITRWPDAIPQYDLEHHQLIDLMKRVEVQHPHLHFIGADRGGVGVPDRVKAAMEFFV